MSSGEESPFAKRTPLMGGGGGGGGGLHPDNGMAINHPTYRVLAHQHHHSGDESLSMGGSGSGGRSKRYREGGSRRKSRPGPGVKMSQLREEGIPGAGGDTTDEEGLSSALSD